MDGVGAADGVGAHFGQTDVLDVAVLNQVGDGADGVFDRHRRVEARRAVDVDVFDAEALQRIGGEVFHRGRAVVDAAEAAGRVAQRAELDADLRGVAVAAHQRLAQQQFVVAHGVEVAGVEQGDAGVERGVDGGDGFGAVGRTVPVLRHAHQAEADLCHLRAGVAELTCLHGISRVVFKVASRYRSALEGLCYY